MHVNSEENVLDYFEEDDHYMEDTNQYLHFSNNSEHTPYKMTGNL